MTDKLYIGFAGQGPCCSLLLWSAYTPHPVDALSNTPHGTSIVLHFNANRSKPVLLRARSGADNFFIKFPLIHREIKRDPAFVLLRHETRFYGKHLNQLQDGIYGLFFTKSSWGGYLCCAIFRWFDGYPWDHLQRTQHDVLSVRLTIAAAAQKLHEMGLSHGQLFSGEEHHILYDPAQKMVMTVDFAVSAAG
ncbi:hypothetical protein DFH08DRAFT_947403 [Mycena albidolilacea]|uniref:Protein kinase domain-containing protein n=1 Tax=Mycena albidolilacea TaxID=1033008 RepID=A0AAD7AVC9_9AGAR|nr:hypothetical protein DFH08DRAFT_947403 [Mycena albidolilacea]